MAVRRDSALVGKVPAGATHWTLSRKGALSWEPCTHRVGSEWQHEMPLEDLSLATIRRRWGEGTYRASFLAISRAGRQLLGHGRIFEVTGGGERTPTPRPGRAGAEGAAPDDHSDMVRALLRAGDGKRSAAELFEALAIPTGMGLSSLFASLDRVAERLDAIERRLAAVEQLRGPAPQAARDEAPLEPHLDPRRDPHARSLERVLDKLEAIEQRLAPGPQRRPSPPARRGRDSPPPRG